MPCVDHWERSPGNEGPTPTTEADPALSLLYVSKALFHPVLDCIVSSLTTQIPRGNG